MAFLSPTTKTLLVLFILILYVFSGVFSKFERFSYEKKLCEKYTMKSGPCTNGFDPVCSKDFVTYLNLCYFCQTFGHAYPGRVRFQKFGPCPKKQ
ncbi:serine protease inhibitor Kazal-type 2-like [Notamacropus eugenii]|uniref:serine protease inhibitor Kazal-type 2-like n=1 Tax=Notamacropus eugenii TaxID=9315 RepID=UPI003B67C01A